MGSRDCSFSLVSTNSQALVLSYYTRILWTSPLYDSCWLTGPLLVCHTYWRTGRFAVSNLKEFVSKISSLYDTQERVKRSEQECGLPTTTTRNAQGHVPKPESNETRDTQSRDKKERSTSPENSTAAIPEPRPSISSNALKAYSTSEEGILQGRCLNCGDKRHTTNECERITDNSEEMQQMREIFKEGLEKGVKCKERRAAVD